MLLDCSLRVLFEPVSNLFEFLAQKRFLEQVSTVTVADADAESAIPI